MSIYKACRCCPRTYTAATWLALPFVGIQDAGEFGRLVLRNCVCGSTLAVEQRIDARRIAERMVESC